MNLLLDTAAFLWLCSGDERLSSAAAAVLADAANAAQVSAVTAWEIALKQAKGKLELPAPVESWFPKMIRHHRLDLLSIEAGTAIASTRLPAIHADPFDRLLVATALERNLTFLTPDAKLREYPGLRTVW